jgi:hypothetical protein
VAQGDSVFAFGIFMILVLVVLQTAIAMKVKHSLLNIGSCFLSGIAVMERHLMPTLLGN